MKSISTLNHVELFITITLSDYNCLSKRSMYGCFFAISRNPQITITVITCCTHRIKIAETFVPLFNLSHYCLLDKYPIAGLAPRIKFKNMTRRSF